MNIKDMKEFCKDKDETRQFLVFINGEHHNLRIKDLCLTLPQKEEKEPDLFDEDEE